MERYTPLFESKKIIAYHGSSSPITKFDRKFSAQGVFWFSENKDKILKGESGAVSTKYIIEVVLTVNKTAGWDEYERLSLGEIYNLGYDSIHLDDDWVIFNNRAIKIKNIEKYRENYTPLFEQEDYDEFEETIKWQYVIRNGKKVRKPISDNPSMHIEYKNDRPKEVRTTGAEKKQMSVQAKKTARKVKSKKASTTRKRQKSLAKRTWGK